MASPMDTFKNNLFDQLKSYGGTVQDVFEQRIARPLLALKRELSRSTSSSHTESQQESVMRPNQTSIIKQQESLLASSSPIEINDIETSASLKTKLDKVQYTLSSPERCISEVSSTDDSIKPTRECRHASISSRLNRNHPRNLLRHKSVSFADTRIQYYNDDDDVDNNDNDTGRSSQYLIDEQRETLANGHACTHNILMSRINEGTIHPIDFLDRSPILDDHDHDFKREFYQSIRPRRISIGNSHDLIYQDLSAEIVSYVLKHALRMLEKEDEDLLLAANGKTINTNEYDEDFIDLK
ncbi:unnamed protein product [Rotaria magnacalcarata]|uniref:Uncharacterized protein n=3 Tax=Rotaria magnacalcarata TaxID=392030 RepID=A0A818Y0U8_9BILA|nr:unnamed protein product [Rotaria magnacalcarata]CAF1407605.1 unnamed protein product [Rotaria magnacalcarata]CAF2104149.1 unnamed protein product [Rotaria magnacalcarata]CAF2175522.1 unnamed protein product [Rotaria magnacalcarata]CAF3740278.1 unnamed protein product [Rotaria magnacalcarata]